MYGARNNNPKASSFKNDSLLHDSIAFYENHFYGPHLSKQHFSTLNFYLEFRPRLVISSKLLQFNQPSCHVAAESQVPVWTDFVPAQVLRWFSRVKGRIQPLCTSSTRTSGAPGRSRTSWWPTSWPRRTRPAKRPLTKDPRFESMSKRKFNTYRFVYIKNCAT